MRPSSCATAALAGAVPQAVHRPGRHRTPTPTPPAIGRSSGRRHPGTKFRLWQRAICALLLGGGGLAELQSRNPVGGQTQYSAGTDDEHPNRHTPIPLSTFMVCHWRPAVETNSAVPRAQVGPGKGGRHRPGRRRRLSPRCGGTTAALDQPGAIESGGLGDPAPTWLALDAAASPSSSPDWHRLRLLRYTTRTADQGGRSSTRARSAPTVGK